MPISESASEADSLPIMLHSDYDDYSDTTSDLEIVVLEDEPDSPAEQPVINVPMHPISAMQAAFAESMHEAAQTKEPPPKNRIASAQARRKILIDQELHEDTHAGRWKQKPGQKFHQLWKLMAQISFGIYLLLHGLAKDEQQVLVILQKHVDEIDEFLEDTIEDFELAKKDIDERLKFLQLPLENIDIFDAMLEDRNFRMQIVTGNERIEHIITRTATAMNDALRDVREGLDATRVFAKYLTDEEDRNTWHKGRRDMQRVYDAMKGNTNGWQKALMSLQSKGEALSIGLVQLGTVVAEMDKRAGEVSRNTRTSVITPAPLSPAQSPTLSPRLSTNLQRSLSRTLPSDPDLISPAIKSVLPAFTYVQERDKTPDSPPETVHEEEKEEEESKEDSAAEEELEEPILFLKPHTYSPVPSPTPSPGPTKQRMDRQPSKEMLDSASTASDVPREPRQQQSNDRLREPQRQQSRDRLRDPSPNSSAARSQTSRDIGRDRSPNSTSSQEKLKESRRKLSQDLLREGKIQTSEVLMREARRQPSQEMLREQPRRQPSQEMLHDQARRQPSQDLLRDQARRQPSQDMLRKQPSHDVLRDSRRQPSQDMLRETRRQPSQDLLREPRRPSSRDALRESGVLPNDATFGVPKLVDNRPRTRDGNKPVQIDIPRKSSMRERFSMRRQGTESGATIKLPPRDPDLYKHRAEQAQPERRNVPIRTINPSSAYYSDADQSSVHSGTTKQPSPILSYFQPPPRHEFSPSIMTPRSEQQYFRPVQPNPNSPLQRPWTATTAPPMAGIPSRNLQSSMGMSIKSQQSSLSQTTVVTEGGTKLKKKRSGFGWLKKAFSLSEEEKAAFEARRRAPVEPHYQYRQPQPRFLDGRRLN